MRTPKKASTCIQDLASPKQQERENRNQSSADATLTDAPHSPVHQREKLTGDPPPAHRHKHHPAQSSQKPPAPTNPRRAEPKERRNTTLKPGKGDLKHSRTEKKKKNEKTEKY